MVKEEIVVEWVKANQTIVVIVVLFVLLILGPFLVTFGIISDEAGAWLSRSSLIVLMIIAGYKIGSKISKKKS